MLPHPAFHKIHFLGFGKILVIFAPFNLVQEIVFDNLERFFMLQEPANLVLHLGALLRIDYPAALELTLPDIPGKRFISLVGMEDEQFLIDPIIAGRRSLSFSEIEKYWSGQALFLWKDSLDLLKSISPGSEGIRIKQLQDLLKEAGAYSKPVTGVYDGDTLLAVKNFQASREIEQDGVVGGQTLMLLYRSVDRFQVPRLAAGRK